MLWYMPREIAIRRTVKLFRNGRSQAVRLPADFRFEGTEVFIRKDSRTGDVILSARPHTSWKSFFLMRDQIGVPKDFLSKRGDGPPQDRELF
jgi:antitoxin VapB